MWVEEEQIRLPLSCCAGDCFACIFSLRPDQLIPKGTPVYRAVAASSSANMQGQVTEATPTSAPGLGANPCYTFCKSYSTLLHLHFSTRPVDAPPAPHPGLCKLWANELGKDISTWFACILCTPLPVARPRRQDDCSCYIKRNSHMGQKAKKPKTCLWLSCLVCLGGKRAHLSMTQITWWTCGCST